MLILHMAGSAAAAASDDHHDNCYCNSYLRFVYFIAQSAPELGTFPLSGNHVL